MHQDILRSNAGRFLNKQLFEHEEELKEIIKPVCAELQTGNSFFLLVGLHENKVSKQWMFFMST